MSSLPSHSFILAGNRYRTTVLGAIRGRQLYLRLLKALAPMLQTLDPSKLQEDHGQIFPLIAAAVSEFPEKLLDDLCEAFGEKTVYLVNDKELTLDPGMFDLHFAGRPGDVISFVVECVKFNKFLDFLPATSKESSKAEVSG